MQYTLYGLGSRIFYFSWIYLQYLPILDGIEKWPLNRCWNVPTHHYGNKNRIDPLFFSFRFRFEQGRSVHPLGHFSNIYKKMRVHFPKVPTFCAILSIRNPSYFWSCRKTRTSIESRSVGGCCFLFFFSFLAFPLYNLFNHTTKSQFGNLH